MYSGVPKVLHQLAGKSLLEHVYHTAAEMQARAIHIVYGSGGGQVPGQLAHLQVEWVEQRQQSGTGHALQQALPGIADEDMVLVLYGDVPLITAETLNTLVAVAAEDSLGLLTCSIDDPYGYGHIIRGDDGRVLRIVEDRDAGSDEKRINEINTGIMAAYCKSLKQWVDRLDDNNAQGEFYLTDVIAMAVESGVSINTVEPQEQIEIKGVNDRAQLSELERYYQLVQAYQLMRKGVTLADPGRFDLRGELNIGTDCAVDINVILEGRLKIGKGVRIGAHCVIRDSIIDDEVNILPHSIIEDAVIGSACHIGPFARIRPGTVLNERARLGNFVEIKNSTIGGGTKINHLSYIGDSDVGTATNIGAGVITCNYDGARKHKTIIGDNVFVGSDVQLIAPVSVSSGATIAAGTTVSKDVTGNALAISRPPQRSIPDWRRPE